MKFCFDRPSGFGEEIFENGGRWTMAGSVELIMRKSLEHKMQVQCTVCAERVHQGLTLAGIIATEKHTLMFGST